MSIELIPSYMPADAPSGEKYFFDLASKENDFDKWSLFGIPTLTDIIVRMTANAILSFWDLKGYL